MSATEYPTAGTSDEANVASDANNAEQADHSFRLSLLVGGLVGLAVAAILVSNHGDRYRLPDYGDLWRWAINTHEDRILTADEAFSRVSLFGHNHVVTRWLSARAAEDNAYEWLWLPGVIAVAISCGVVTTFAMYFGVAKEKLRPRQVVGLGVASAICGLSLVRFDFRRVYLNSLLVFAQTYYLMAILAVLVAAYLQSRSGRRIEHAGAYYVALYLALLLGDAPTGLALGAIAFVAVGGGLVERSWQHVSRVALTGVLVTATKWGARAVAGRSGTSVPPESSPLDLLSFDVLADTLKLVGAAFVRLSPPRKPDPHAVYLAIGLLVVVLVVLATSYRVWERLHAVGLQVERTSGTRNRDALFLAGLMLVLTSSAAALFAVGIRGIGDNYDESRFVRSIEFIPPGMLLLAMSFFGSRRSVVKRSAVALFVFLSLFLGVRLMSFSAFTNTGPADRSANRKVELFCVPEIEDIEWKQLSANISPKMAERFSESELLAHWRSDLC